MKIHLHIEIEKLKKKILAYGAMVDDAIGRAIKALKERDIELADKIISDDKEMDSTEVEIEEDCLKLLALYSPVANDLRFIITVLKINNDLERIADQAVNIAERAKFLSSHSEMNIPYELTLMCEKTIKMLENSLNSLINQDVNLAHEVIMADDEVDALHSKMYSIIQNRIREDLDKIGCLISILIVSRYLERIADQVTNIAEDVIYLVSGDIVRHSGSLE
jgi:phosphate transport system protein